MKRTILIFLSATLLFSACSKSEMNSAEVYNAKAKSHGKPVGPKNKITVDFAAISDQRAIVTITGTDGEGPFVFDSIDGVLQSQVIPRKSTYTVQWEYFAVTPVPCNYMLYWNYTGISIYGTNPYSFISTCCVTFEKNAVFTFYKDCSS